MKNLLLATDFSSPAHNAYEYAYHLSKAMNTTLTVLYVAPPPSDEHFFKSENLNQKLLEADQEKYTAALKRFISKYPSQYKDDVTALHHVNYFHKKGKVVEEIIKTAEEIESDLVIIGTRYKHNLWDHLLGSTSTDLVKQSTASVLVIPHQVAYHPIKTIAFANALELEDELPQKTIQSFAQTMDAIVQHVHVDLDATEEEMKKEKSSVFYQSSNPLKSMAIVRDNTISNGLNYFLDNHSIDLLAMSLSNPDGLPRLFHKSQTKKMTYQTKLPLLICKG